MVQSEMAVLYLTDVFSFYLFFIVVIFYYYIFLQKENSRQNDRPNLIEFLIKCDLLLLLLLFFYG